MTGLYQHSFTLLPFEQGATQELALKGVIQLAGTSIKISYELNQTSHSPADLIHWPSTKARAERKDELWTTTCLEFFVAARSQQRYWEYNFSPCGDWNIYQLDSYRHGLKPEPDIQAPTITSMHGYRHYQVEVKTELPKPLADDTTLMAGMTAVVALQNSQNSHWALHHAGATPDFHRRDCFRLPLRSIEHQKS